MSLLIHPAGILSAPCLAILDAYIFQYSLEHTARQQHNIIAAAYWREIQMHKEDKCSCISDPGFPCFILDWLKNSVSSNVYIGQSTADILVKGKKILKRYYKLRKIEKEIQTY